MKYFIKIEPKKILTVFLLALFCFACLDEIPFGNSENTLQSIMIRGKLRYGSPSNIQVNISDLSDFVKYDFPNPIIDAQVILKSASGGSLEIPMINAGTYELEILQNHPTIQIEIGQSYQIIVAIPGRGNYESTLEPLLEVPAIEQINKNVLEREVLDDLENIETRLFLEVTVDTPLELPDNPNRSFLKWEFEGAYKFPEATIKTQPLRPLNLCYYFDPLNLDKVVVFNGDRAAQPVLSKHFLMEEPIDFRFFRGFYLNVIQQSLSEGAFKYWQELSNVIDRDGSFFETLPAMVGGNFKQLENPEEIVFGYFYATAEDSARIYINAKEAGFPRPKCRGVEDFEEFLNQPDICRNCLIKQGSTVKKPDFWVD